MCLPVSFAEAATAFVVELELDDRAVRRTRVRARLGEMSPVMIGLESTR